jgi:hypothetical protein
MGPRRFFRNRHKDNGSFSPVEKLTTILRQEVLASKGKPPSVKLFLPASARGIDICENDYKKDHPPAKKQVRR